MLRFTLLLGSILTVLVLLPSASQAATCSVKGLERKLGPTYTTRLAVSGTSCSSGKKLVKAYYSCRKANGGADGTCHKKVLGFSCTEKRPKADTVPGVSFGATVTCKRGSKRIVHDYQQFI